MIQRFYSRKSLFLITLICGVILFLLAWSLSPVNLKNLILIFEPLLTEKDTEDITVPVISILTFIFFTLISLIGFKALRYIFPQKCKIILLSIAIGILLFPIIFFFPVTFPLLEWMEYPPLSDSFSILHWIFLNLCFSFSCCRFPGFCPWMLFS